MSSTVAQNAETEVAAAHRHGRGGWISIAEAVLLSLVAVLTAYSGFAAAKWGTRSSIELAAASQERTQGSRDESLALVTRTLDSASFNAWFTAYTLHNRQAEHLALRRLRPGYRVAFNAWLATDPAHNANAPAGPSYMPQYVLPQAQAAQQHYSQADRAYAHGQAAGADSDDYIRITVFLASVLFLVGISGQFQIRFARFALVGVGTVILLFAVVQLATLHPPP